jgi:hypothetical protein
MLEFCCQQVLTATRIVVALPGARSDQGEAD